MVYHPTIDRLFHEMWNQHQADSADELFAEPFVVHYGDDLVSSLTEFKGLLNEWFVGIPDIHHDILDYFEMEGRVVVRWKGYGTHLGPFVGIEPTGRSFHYSGITIFDLDRAGKITKAWVGTDFNGQLQALRDE